MWLLRRGATGYVLAGALLVLNLLLSLSMLSSTVFQYAMDPSTSLAILPFFANLAVASLLLTIVYLGSINDHSNMRRAPDRARRAHGV